MPVELTNTMRWKSTILAATFFFIGCAATAAVGFSLPRGAMSVRMQLVELTSACALANGKLGTCPADGAGSKEIITFLRRTWVSSGIISSLERDQASGSGNGFLVYDGTFYLRAGDWSPGTD